MKVTKIAVMMGVAALWAVSTVEAAPPGQWSFGGFTQWHPNDGRTGLGVAGTQCYFCKPEGQPAAPPPPPPPPPAKQPPGDEDGDGVTDDLDQCPGTPKGAPVNKVGCWVVKNLNFRTNSAQIESKDASGLRETLVVLQKNPNLKVEIQGHTDNVGKAPYNKKLSLARANTVMNYFISQGVDKKRLTANGYGLEKPVASNANEAGRAENRRVELKVLK
ncbi:OmpA family protein [Candidatus Magnetaquicoccus inordinatus]|uniref:OmpA family protein n=1 Tax=Candidatus Magnetaquicoccus inordinatus TaxID=2496818 RepID=UPI00187D1886|nr:OmpA family protein [Candidatus Magnetaquicoccus inordinatus]